MRQHTGNVAFSSQCSFVPEQVVIGIAYRAPRDSDQEL